jgi:predicted DNA-binding protein (MmcQ/YjbR family)
MTPDDLRGLVQHLPSVTEDTKWDHLCFLVGAKIFALAGYTPDSPVCFKVSGEDFAILTDREDIRQAPHFARGQWVVVDHPRALTRLEWKEYLSKSYALVAEKLPKKTRKELGLL